MESSNNGHCLSHRSGQTDRLRCVRTRRAAHPSGAVMVMVIVCLMVVMMLAAAIAQNLVFHQRQTRADQDRLQAFWLAESALDRAAAELLSDPRYAGNEWQVEIDRPAGSQTGVAQIRVESDDSAPRQRRIQIVARWPDDPVHRYVHHKDLIINLADPGDSP